MKTLIIIAIVIAALVLLYFLMIMPRVVGKPSMKEFQKWLYAHRGLHDNLTDAPENSMKAFEKAVDAGFGIEMDIQLTKDNVPVVFHDFTLNRICGVDGKVRNFTYEELQQFPLCRSKECIPRLEDVLKMVNGRVPLIVEFKMETANMSLCLLADRLLRKYKGTYCMESFNPLALLWYQTHRKDVVRGQLSDAFLKEGEYTGVLYFIMQNLLLNFLGRPDFVAYNCKYPNMLSRKICRRLYGNKAAAWTIKSEEQLCRARKNFDFFIFDSFVPLEKC